MNSKNKKGFTLIELLVVISIISLLSSIVLASFSNTKAKSRDAVRASDMHQIKLAIDLYYNNYGCLPITSGTSCPGAGGYSELNQGSWDYSSQGTGFMTFLKNSGYLSKDLLDPINNMTGDGTPVGTYAYKYYCYTTDGPVLAYVKETTGVLTYILNHDSGYVCK